MAFMILFFLPSFPFSAGFLTQRERAIAQARLNRDQRPQSHGGMSGGKGILTVITDIHAWMFTVLYASCKFVCTIMVQPHSLLATQSMLVLPLFRTSCPLWVNIYLPIEMSGALTIHSSWSVISDSPQSMPKAWPSHLMLLAGSWSSSKHGTAIRLRTEATILWAPVRYHSRVTSSWPPPSTSQ